MTPSMLVLLLALVRADVVTVEIPEALIDGDIPANAAAYCRQHGLGPTPRGVACADAVLLDAGASLGRRSLARAARGDADGAVEDARRRTEIARQDAAAWRQYGLALLDRNHEGDARDAAAALELAVAGDPTDLGAAHSLARARALTKPPAALRVATFASAETCGLRRLLASARHHGVDVDVLGGANRTWLCGNQVQAPFNSWSLAVGARCCSLDTVACIARRSCPSLGRKHESRDSLVDFHAVPHGRHENPARQDRAVRDEEHDHQRRGEPEEPHADQRNVLYEPSTTLGRKGVVRY